jgi:hypothetical protein
MTVVLLSAGYPSADANSTLTLIEELAGILWRKRRLRLAEAATVRRGLEGTFASYHRTVDVALAHLDAEDQSECVSVAVRATATDTDEDMADVAADETMTHLVFHGSTV